MDRGRGIDTTGMGRSPVVLFNVAVDFKGAVELYA